MLFTTVLLALAAASPVFSVPVPSIELTRRHDSVVEARHDSFSPGAPLHKSAKRQDPEIQDELGMDWNDGYGPQSSESGSSSGSSGGHFDAQGETPGSNAGDGYNGGNSGNSGDSGDSGNSGDAGDGGAWR